MLKEIQVDNQMRTTNHPVMVTQAVNKGFGERDVFEMSWVRNTQNPSVRHFVYFSPILQVGNAFIIIKNIIRIFRLVLGIVVVVDHRHHH